MKRKTEITTNMWGERIDVHYDEKGKKIGKTEYTKDILGNPKQVHYNENGKKTGYSEKRTDMLGNRVDKNYDNRGKKTGKTEYTKDILGNPKQVHYNENGKKTGYSEKRTDMLGNKIYVHHYRKPKEKGDNSVGKKPSQSRKKYERPQNKSPENPSYDPDLDSDYCPDSTSSIKLDEGSIKRERRSLAIERVLAMDFNERRRSLEGHLTSDNKWKYNEPKYIRDEVIRFNVMDESSDIYGLISMLETEEFGVHAKARLEKLMEKDPEIRNLGR